MPFIGFTQDYQLDFNSATLDYVEMPNASSVIANKTEFTISGWVNPQMDASHSGFFGFRNNSDADFFLLQLQNSTNVEARFRNSAGVNFDVVANSILDIGQWQHLAFTYNGTYLKLYKNGSVVDSAAANGTITNVSQSFKIGSLDYQTSSFPMQGNVDEVRLWDEAISENVISSWMCDPVDLTHPNYNNLMGYWRLNDGNGNVVSDNSPSNLNGTLVSANWSYSTSCFGSTIIPLTYVPDDNFETYLENNGMGDGISLNDSVFTSAIEMVMFLDVSNQNISDMTGIEDFISLVDLDCDNNQLVTLNLSGNPNLDYLMCSNNQLVYLNVNNNLVLNDIECIHNNLSILDVTNNINLEYLEAWDNQLTSLDVSNNINLLELHCNWNSLTNIDVSNNTALEILFCNYNQLTSLDVSMLFNLWFLDCGANQISSLDLSNNQYLEHIICAENNLYNLDIRNGNNQNILEFVTVYNSNLDCINVDDPGWSTSNWTFGNFAFDVHHYFSADCSISAVLDEIITHKDLLKVTDILGREVNEYQNTPLFYIYNDGTVEKTIIFE